MPPPGMSLVALALAVALGAATARAQNVLVAGDPFELTGDTQTGRAYFAFDALADQTYTFASAGPIAFDLAIYFRRAPGDSADGFLTVDSLRNRSFTWVAPAAGRYYLTVVNDSSDANGRPNPYAIRVTHAPTSALELDYLRPGPGRVPLTVTIRGNHPYVGVPLGPGLYRELCDYSPCRLYVPPGRFRLASSIGLVHRTVDVPPNGTAVTYGWPPAYPLGIAAEVVGLAAPVAGAFMMGLADGDRGQFYGGLALLVGGAAIGVGGALLLVFQATIDPVDPRHPHGHHHRANAAPSLDWDVGAAPLPGGAIAAATLRF